MSQQHKILIVDDDHDTHQFIADLLHMYGYEATCVHSSATAREIIPREPPDFLILDLHIDERYAGWLLLQDLRTDPATASIPAVLATSDREFVQRHRNEVQALGGEVLEKPFDPHKLIERVQATLGGV
jgi:DNA-binding response OmpR family regulator